MRFFFDVFRLGSGPGNRSRSAIKHREESGVTGLAQEAGAKQQGADFNSAARKVSRFRSEKRLKSLFPHFVLRFRREKKRKTGAAFSYQPVGAVSPPADVSVKEELYHSTVNYNISLQAHWHPSTPSTPPPTPK